MPFWERNRLARVVFVSLALSARARAEAGADDAARHFERAIAHADAQEFDQALVEFRKAYELSPHYSVQYNIGLAAAAAGRTLAAVEAFERYLADGGAEVPGERHAHVTALLRAERAKLAQLALELEPETAVVLLDGKPASLPEGGLVLEPGKHALVVRAPGYLERSLSLELRAGETSKVVVALTRLGSRKLELACAVPDVEVRLDGTAVGGTADARQHVSIDVPEGAGVLELRRAGYRTQEIQLASITDRRPKCSMEPLAPARTAELALRVSEAGSTVLLDGQPFRGERLVAGRHGVLVQRRGFQPFSRTISVAAGQKLGLDIELAPTAAYRAEYERRARTQRLGAYVLGIAGLGVGVGALATRLYSNHLYGEWESERDRLPPAGAPGTSPEDETAQIENDARQERIQTLDRVALGLGITSAVVVGAGVVLYLHGDDPDRYKKSGRIGVTLRGSTVAVSAGF
ncbi:MAG TPA: PEGA domain-containing protein [Polyangiaceae bacterium]